MKIFRLWFGSALMLFLVPLIDVCGAQSRCTFENLAIEERNPHDSELAFVFRGRPSGIPAGLPRTSFRTIEEVNNYFGSTVTTEDDALQAICTPTRSLPEMITFLRETSGKSATFIITPNSGGSVVLTDGTRLSIPAGAVTQATQAIVQTHGTLNVLDEGGVAIVKLSPDGLILQKSATLTIPYVLNPGTDQTNVQTLIFSAVNPQRQVASEIDISQPANVVNQDIVNSQITITLDHFSFIGVFWPPLVTIIPHIPPDRLRPGDLLFALTDTRWTPGHVGIFDSAPPGARLGQGTCIEATSEPSIPNSCPGITVNGVSYTFGLGVFRQTMDQSFIRSGRLYMGARRPQDTVLSLGTRDLITAFANSQVGKCYLPVGIPDPGGNTHWSCGSLAIASYLNAGVTELLPLSGALGIVWPYALYRKTAAVSDITIIAGETVELPIKVNALVPALPVPQYAENPSGSTLTVSSSTFATLDPASRILKLAPTTAQACTTNTLLLSARGPVVGTDSLSLIVRVNDLTFSQESPIGNTLLTQPQIGVQVASPCDIPLASAVMKLDGTVVASFSSAATGATTTTNLSFTPASPLPSGSHVVSVEAFDQEGAHKTDSFAFTIIDAGPTANILTLDCQQIAIFDSVTFNQVIQASGIVRGPVGLTVEVLAGPGQFNQNIYSFFSDRQITSFSCGDWSANPTAQTCTRSSSAPEQTNWQMTQTWSCISQFRNPPPLSGGSSVFYFPGGISHTLASQTVTCTIQ